MGQQHIKGFDGVRAFAVCAVFLAHRSPLRDANAGLVGVQTFFVLSGFLIVGILHRERLAIEAGRSTWGAAFGGFFKRRTLRIFPIYYAALAGLAVVAATWGYTDWRWDALPWHLVYLSNVYEGHVLHGFQGTLSHLWTLSVEEQFYLLSAPLLLLLPSRFHLRACLAVVAVGYVWHLILRLTGAPFATYYTDSLANFAFIALGGATRLFTADRTWPATSCAWLAGASIAGLGLLPNGGASGESAYVVVPLLAAILIPSLARSQDGLMVRLLELPPLALIGRVSYGFYLYHNLFVYWLPAGFSGTTRTMLQIVINFTIALSVACLSYYVVERPIMGLARRGSAFRTDRTALAR